MASSPRGATTLPRREDASEEADAAGVEALPRSALATWVLQGYHETRHAVAAMMSLVRSYEMDLADGDVAFVFATRFDLDTDVGYRAFASRFRAVPWITYRKDFAPIGNYTFDTGWGCMLRTAQMMLCEALLRVEAPSHGAMARGPDRARVLDAFVDEPGKPFSIHSLVGRGVNFNKMPGAWYEPTLALLVVRDLLERQSLFSLRAVVARDGALDASLVTKALASGTVAAAAAAATTTTTSATTSEDPLLRPRHVDRSVLILVPVRLGLASFNPAYVAPLVAAARFPQCVGFVGGRPSQSLYFVGSQVPTSAATTTPPKFIFLDPHTVFPAAHSAADFLRCDVPRTVAVADLDTSLELGFVVSSLAEFGDLRERVMGLRALGPPMFEILDGPISLRGLSLTDDELEVEEDFAESPPAAAAAALVQAQQQQHQQTSPRTATATATATLRGTARRHPSASSSSGRAGNAGDDEFVLL